MQNRNIFAGIIVLIVLALAGAYLIKRSHDKSAAPTTATSTLTSDAQSTSTTTVAGNGTAQVTTTGNTAGPNGIFTLVDISDAPNVSAPLKFSASVTAAQRADLQNRFGLIQAQLVKDKYDFNALIGLGGVRQQAGDYAGAETDWQYVSKLYPTNKVSFNNLGDLYENNLKNFVKSETNYLQAIKNDPQNPSTYRNAYDLYYVYNYSPAKTEGILKKGIAAVPKAIDLQVLLAQYYRDTGRTADAKAEYNLAIANAKSQGQTDLATTIQTELSAI